MKLHSMIAAGIVLLAPTLAVTQTVNQRNFPNFSASEDLLKEAAFQYPLRWDPSKITWKATLEGYGQSCPLVQGDKLFVTSVIGPNKETYKVACLNLMSGDLLWERRFESSFPEESTPMVSRAAPTPVGDSNRIFLFFESGDFLCYDLDGELQWHHCFQKELHKFENKFGLSATPVQTADKLFLLIDHAGDSSLVCVDKANGVQDWLTARGRRANSWSSPGIVRVENEPIIVCSSVGSIDAYHPLTGKLLCSYTKVGGNSVATPYDLGNGRFLVSSLIRPADGPSENATISNLSARITKQNSDYLISVEWVAKNARGSFSSPVEHTGFCYWLNPQGVLFCLDAKSGEEYYAKRVSCGACWATPFAVGERLYLFGKEGEVSVIRIGSEFEELSSGNRIWEKEVPSSGDESPRSRMAGHTLYAAVPIEKGFLFRRGDVLFRLDNH